MASRFGGARRRIAAATVVVLMATGPAPAAVAQETEDPQEPTDQITNGGFDDGLTGWNVYPQGSVADGWGCVTVPAGTGAYGAGILQNVPLEAGETYELSFLARLVEGTPGPLRTVVQLPREPWTQYLPEQPVAGSIGTEPTELSFTFTASETLDDAELAVVQQTGTNAEAYTVCVDDVALRGGSAVEPYEPETGPRVRVNHVGYARYGPKRATLITEATRPVAWKLRSPGGAVVAAGRTRPRGVDPSAGLNVHTIDFSRVKATSDGYTLVADGETSFPFRIGMRDVYERLRVDALNYYYPARSGIEIADTDELAPADIGGDSYARPAGHVSSPLPADDPDRDPAAIPPDASPNLGDFDVGCQSIENQTDDAGNNYYGQPWSCPDGYRLDVVGGWYDAGDHGRYVVNGGISVYQLMNVYERARVVRSADRRALRDGTLAIPERGNGVPDVLDEARWQLEFLLRMQVPPGTAPFTVGDQQLDLSGMAHHKIHDEGWTGLPLMPHDDPQVRSLHRPSTAATLNLAATAAQGARLFKPYDRKFSKRLLQAARTAWDAANRHPDLYAPAADGQEGGGPYDDDDVSDEFYWAAVELFLTTGEKRFERAVQRSPHHTGDVFPDGGFSWQDVAALGRLDLALVPNRIRDRHRVRHSVLRAADELVALQRSQPFGQAYAGDGDGEYVWGSNSQILNNLVVLGVAYDISPRDRYLDAVFESMDYLLGRNALNWSYVTGYGEQEFTSVNQHSRWWADQLDPSLPNPPPGSVSGGPNSHEQTWDPTISGLYPDADCPPQQCYVDHIQSWSTNEITINWNAALSWVASFVADQDDGRRPKSKHSRR